jgi:dihydroorotate dehydrogenase (NAD+) catalytic subunit
VDPRARQPAATRPRAQAVLPRLRIDRHAEHRVHQGDGFGTGGVTRGEDVVEMLLAGASAVGVGTVTFREPRAMLRILGELDAWCTAHGVLRVADLIGALKGDA